VVPDFALPAAYTVNNVPPLNSKMESFSDETLIMIFYQHPRDITQELAAQVLYKRDWRWHKVMRCWMMKVITTSHPIH
jgi:CCR4-NOT transcription complex subunit 2